MWNANIISISIFLLVITLNTNCVSASTWMVERDGSGDFTVIQDAVNAAASGDTVYVGPGRYNEGQTYTTPGWTEFVRVLVSVPEITIIGSGDETIIGQEESWNLDQGVHQGVVASYYFGNSKLVLEKLCFENMGLGIRSENVDLIFRGCLFRHCWTSVSVSSFSTKGSQVIENCRFENLERDGLHLHGDGTSGLVVRNCEFSLWPSHTWNQNHMNCSGVSGMLVAGCNFHEGAGGVTVGLGSTGTLRECTFDGQSINAFVAGPGSALVVEGCTFRQQDRLTRLPSSDTHLTVRDCVIEDVQDCCVIVSSVGSLSFQDCDLAAGDRGTIWVEDCMQTPPMHLDFTNNYWGTDDPDSIQALIHDRNDSDAICRYVDFEPFLNESTPVETKCMSDLKSLFR